MLRGTGWHRQGRAMWVAGMEGEEQGAGKVGVCGAAAMGRQGWDVWGWGKGHGSSMWGGVVGLGYAGLRCGKAEGVQERLGCVGLAGWGALPGQIKGTTSVGPRRVRRGSAVLGVLGWALRRLCPSPCLLWVPGYHIAASFWGGEGNAAGHHVLLCLGPDPRVQASALQ